MVKASTRQRASKAPMKASKRSRAASSKKGRKVEEVKNEVKDDVDDEITGVADDVPAKKEDTPTIEVNEQPISNAEQSDALPSSPKPTVPNTPVSKEKSKAKATELAVPKKPKSVKIQSITVPSKKISRGPRIRKPALPTTRQLRQRKPQAPAPAVLPPSSPTPAKRSIEDEVTGRGSKKRKLVQFDPANLEQAKTDATEVRSDPLMKGMKSPKGRRATGRPQTKSIPERKPIETSRLSELGEVSTIDTDSHLPTQPEESDKEKSPERKRRRGTSERSKSQKSRKAKSKSSTNVKISRKVTVEDES